MDPEQRPSKPHDVHTAPLTADQLRYARLIFDQIDHSGEGHLHFDGVKQLLASKGFGEVHEWDDFHEEFHSYDVDGDDCLNFEEFSHWLVAHMAAAGEQHAEAGRPQVLNVEVRLGVVTGVLALALLAMLVC